MRTIKDIRPEGWFLLLLAVSLYGYVVCRGYFVGITHDEAFTYNWYVPQSAIQVITYDIFPVTPNNHILNTLLVKCFAQFGQHPFWLRLPTLLFFGVFLLVAARWLLQGKQPFLAVPGMLLLLGNPYLLDFFGLARGYGMGLTFLLLACLALFRYRQQPASGRVWFIFLTALLSVEANMILLHFYFALCVVFLLVLIGLRREGELPGWKQFLAHVQPMVWLSLLLGLLLAEPIDKIAHSGQLTGGDAGFWQDTVRSLLQQTLYEQPYAAAAIPWLNAAFVLLLVLLTSTVFFLLVRKGWQALQQPFVLVFFILVVSASSIIVQHHLFHSPYLRERMGLFYLILFSMAFISWLSVVAQRAKYLALAGAMLPALLLAVHLVRSANTRYALEWRYDCNTLEMLHYLDGLVQKDGAVARPVRLGINPVFTPSINFYRNTHGFDWLEPAHVDGFEKEKTYRWGYILPPDLDNASRRLNGEALKTFEPSGALLVQ